MLWFKVFLTDIEILQQLDKKLLSEFLELLSELGAPPSLALHTSTLSPITDYYYLFSTPEQYTLKLTTIFDSLKYEEILQPDLLTIKCYIGKFEK